MPKIKEWARIVTGLLKPGGRLFLREFHPVLWSLDRKSPQDLIINTPYFEREEPIILEAPKSYADLTGQDFKLTKFAVYNHGISEVIQALLEDGMTLTLLKEHQSAPLLSMLRQLMIKEKGEYSLKDRPWRLPLSYTIQAVKELGAGVAKEATARAVNESMPTSLVEGAGDSILSGSERPVVSRSRKNAIMERVGINLTGKLWVISKHNFGIPALPVTSQHDSSFAASESGPVKLRLAYEYSRFIERPPRSELRSNGCGLYYVFGIGLALAKTRSKLPDAEGFARRTLIAKGAARYHRAIK
ncbi:hypothetical protein NM208_g9059 [Fusarium decemcellulare]|uniref:Uncharacterized protein n=1 Tax=Fusarium decemcellulare TaxID=57161 RepID=A0ACC1S2Z3_9HYPO|nr:hypothetical protein NM208_g9059 [Fusarium decemcellulare]